MYMHLRGERAETGEGCSQDMGNLMLLFYQGWWSTWGNLLCDFTTKHLKMGDQNSSWGNGTCWSACRAQKQAWGWALAVAAASIFPERCAGGVDGGPQAVCTQVTLASADQTNMLLCQLKIIPFGFTGEYYITSYTLTCISVKIIQESKLLGYHNPSSQTPSTTREGVRCVMRSFFQITPQLGLISAVLYKNGKGEFCCQRWV